MFLKCGVLLFVSIFCSLASLDKLSEGQKILYSSKPESIYLPAEAGLNLLSLGYKTALAHSIWFNAINYFGKHYRGDKDYKWLDHYCKITIKLAPQVKDYYQFCGTILAWEASSPEAAIEIYSSAIENFPNDWLFYYLRGFTKAYFLNQQEEAKNDFIASASKPGANPVVVRLASKKIVTSAGIEQAVEFLKNAIELTADPASKSILEHRLEELKRSDSLEKNSVDWQRNFKKDLP